jgi:O-antigen ligase
MKANINKAKDKSFFVKTLLFLTVLFSVLGLITVPKISFLASFAIAVIWILFIKQEALGGLSLLWIVKVQPAPSDIIFLWIWLKRLLNRNIKWVSLLSINLFITFALMNVIQLIYVKSFQRGLFFVGATIYMLLLALLFLSYTQKGSKNIWSEILYFYIFSVVLSAIIILLLAIIKYIGYSGNISQLYAASRPKGFFKDPNVAGPFIVTGCLFAISNILFNKKPVWGKFGALFLLTLFGVILTFSRGALLNLFTGLTVILLIALKLKKGTRFLNLFLPILLLFALLIPFLVNTYGQAGRFTSLARYDIFGRFNAWRSGIMIFRDYPLGVGPGQFEIYSPTYESHIMGAIITPSAHNLYLRVLVENGIVGFICLFGAFAVLISDLYKSVKLSIKANDQWLITNGSWLLSSLAGILIESFVIDTLHWRHFWIIIGLTLSYIFLTKHYPKRSGSN